MDGLDRRLGHILKAVARCKNAIAIVVVLAGSFGQGHKCHNLQCPTLVCQTVGRKLLLQSRAEVLRVRNSW